jgi:hypothetical protein
MPMIGRAHNDGVNVLTRQELPVVSGREDVVAPDFLAVLETAVVTIRDGHELYARNLERSSRIALALTTRPDQRDLNVIVGRNRSGRSGLIRCQCVHLCSKDGPCSCRARHFQESSAIQHSYMSSQDRSSRRLQQ